MDRRILIDSLCGQTRLALIENGELCEYYSEVEEVGSITGNIYVGRVQNVLPGMNAAFVDIGFDKNAFLYAGDIKVDARADSDLSAELNSQQISKLVKNGQNVLVQVVKDSDGMKGARVSCHATIAGRLLVLMPTIKHIGISRRITDAAERERLLEIGQKLRDEYGCGLIMRTAAAGADEESLLEECKYFRDTWESIKRHGALMPKPSLVYSYGGLVSRAIRDMLNSETSELVTDSAEIYRKARAEAALVAPEYVDKLTLRKNAMPLFDIYKIESELKRAFARNIRLKSGGCIIIDYTEALTVIDVNTGKFVGKKSLDDTIFITNCEAAQEIARQLRLRNIGGIVIVDFIDMIGKKHKEDLLARIKTELARDRRHTNFSGITSLGLVEITRKKTHQPLHNTHMTPCPVCKGSGYMPSIETSARRVLYDLRRRVCESPNQAFMVFATPHIISEIKRIGVPQGCITWLCASDTAKIPEITAFDAQMLPSNAIEAPYYIEKRDV